MEGSGTLEDQLEATKVNRVKSVRILISINQFTW